LKRTTELVARLRFVAEDLLDGIFDDQDAVVVGKQRQTFPLLEMRDSDAALVKRTPSRTRAAALAAGSILLLLGRRGIASGGRRSSVLEKTQSAAKRRRGFPGLTQGEKVDPRVVQTRQLSLHVENHSAENVERGIVGNETDYSFS